MHENKTPSDNHGNAAFAGAARDVSQNAPSMLHDGLAAIIGGEYAFVVELADRRVVRFRRSTDRTWTEPAGHASITPELVEQTDDRIALRWTYVEMNTSGQEALRQEFHFEGTRSGDVGFAGRLAYRMRATFLNPPVQLANASTPARLTFDRDATQPHAA